MDARLHALNRFGLGARPGEKERLGDPRDWLRAQLKGGAPLQSAPADASAAAIFSAVRTFRQVGANDPAQRQQARRALVGIAVAEQRAALNARITSERPFVERVVAFWSNHLCISTSKFLVAPLAGSYEREAIRPHVLGRFEDLVLASARHPAMLAYLDNFQSIGPMSRAASFARRRDAVPRGLNENYARELMELHTIGVNGGYTQADVEEMAKALTGWTITGLRARGAFASARRDDMTPGRRRFARLGRQAPMPAPGDTETAIRFAFDDRLHEPGARSVLGTRYRDAGADQGEQIIRALCRHPSTSRNVAMKLVAHFVGDEPAADAVDRVATVFRSTDGDLARVSAALIDLPQAWQVESRKFRAPQDWLVATFRAVGVHDAGDMSGYMLRQLRHPLWGPQSPKGFGDALRDWADPDALLNRGELSRTLVRRFDLASVDPRLVLEIADVGDRDPLRTLVSDQSVPSADRVALALASPALQWR
jgi:uncharacterized protein (DUF1800 family)